MQSLNRELRETPSSWALFLACSCSLSGIRNLIFVMVPQWYHFMVPHATLSDRSDTFVASRTFYGKNSVEKCTTSLVNVRGHGGFKRGFSTGYCRLCEKLCRGRLDGVWRRRLTLYTNAPTRTRTYRRGVGVSLGDWEMLLSPLCFFP